MGGQQGATLLLTSNQFPTPPLARELSNTRQPELDQDAQALEALTPERMPRLNRSETDAINYRAD